ncbi:MAG: bifunctional riboflavin kinase/FAD synthetase [Chthonomonadales bacterium]|nr:bifunctional riboflavin kinase/FAD synthetase [Chthonomonadales bacterium]
MRVWDGIESVDPPLVATSVAIGTFDGVHLGHQALIGTAVADARANGRAAVVFTFDRHPAETITPGHTPGYLTTPARRAALIGELGADDLVVARFDEALRQMTAEDFVRQVLSGRLGARAVVAGQGFRFGRDQRGDDALLQSLGQRLGFEVRSVAPVLVDGERVSSTRVRQLVQEGSVERAARVLGRPYAIAGVVERGQRLGRRLGYPTANVRTTYPLVVPGDGVYATWALLGEARRPGACSVGLRPTVDGRSRVIEVFILDYSGDLYGRTVELQFVSRLREQRRFESLEALTEQMRLDVEQVARTLRGVQ